jgi:hypothetical protein
VSAQSPNQAPAPKGRKFWVFAAGVIVPLVIVWLGGEDFRLFKSNQQGQPGATVSAQSSPKASPHPSTGAPPRPSTAGTTSKTAQPTTNPPSKKPAKPRYWPLGATPSANQILSCIQRVAREKNISYQGELDDYDLKPAAVGKEATLRIRIDPRDEGYYLWVRDATCTPRKVLELQPGDQKVLHGAWTGGYATLIPFTDQMKSMVGQEGPTNPDVSWTGGASYQFQTTTMLWSWS